VEARVGRPVGVLDVRFVPVDDEGADGVGKVGEEDEGAAGGYGGGWHGCLIRWYVI
jgi:hypothetical protein